jgi:hypothetical protein
MGLKDIVVYVDSTEATKARVGFAVGLAKEHGAHLIGIAFAPTALLPLYGADVGFADMSEVMASVKAQGATALKDFETRAKADGVSVEAELLRRGRRRLSHQAVRRRRAAGARARRAATPRLGRPEHGRSGLSVGRPAR